MTPTQKMRSTSSFWLWLVLAIGTALRLVMPLRGHNFDMDSWRIIADIMNQGGNVYFETYRYKYGPIWFHILHALDALLPPSLQTVQALHYKIAFFLTLVDVGIALILFRSLGLLVATLFFLNPISIIITGYHGQFDNVAVLLGLLAVLFLKDLANPKKCIAALILLGLSLSVKHILFIFPLWLAFKQPTWRAKCLTMFIPYGVFLIGFLPYWNGGQSMPVYGNDENGLWGVVGQTGLVENVFLYQSFNNAPFWRALLPNVIFDYLSPTLLFIGTLILLGYWWRKKGAHETLNLYLIAVVAFSSAIANQYLTIPTAGIATQWNWFYASYTAISTLQLAADWPGLHIGAIQKLLSWEGIRGKRELLYSLASIFLCLGLLQTQVRTALQSFYKKAVTWIK